jgi:hypothetical protein
MPKSFEVIERTSVCSQIITSLSQNARSAITGTSWNSAKVGRHLTWRTEVVILLLHQELIRLLRRVGLCSWGYFFKWGFKLRVTGIS